MKESNEKTTVLITCGGSPAAPELIQALRASKKPEFRVVATDVRSQAIGRGFADAFFTVPPGSSAEYAESLLAICRHEGVRAVMPGSDEEAFALCRSREAFAREGVSCLVPEFVHVDLLADKGLMYRWLADRGVAVPGHHAVRTVEDVSAAAEEFGYPEKSFVIKPAGGRGGRGVWRIEAKDNRRTELLRRSGWNGMDLKDFTARFKDAGSGGWLAMPLFEGDIYDVDVLEAEKGETYLVPRKRFNRAGIPFEGCEIVNHPAILKKSIEIQKVLRLGYLADLDIALDAEGEAQLLEVNPRPSGSVIATVAAGLNLVEFAVRKALGLAVPKKEIPFGKRILSGIRTVCENS